MLWFILVLLFVGFIIGGVARFLVPGPDPMGLLGTWALGVGGSLVGGFLGYFILGADVDDGPVQAAGFVGSVIGAVVILLVMRFRDRKAGSPT
jgi:uncharacterized membrane protein YeaQ/YmgE (transglycosylase-associated protein family)